MDRFARAVSGPLSWLFVFATAISAYEVVMRYVFGLPSSWVHVTATAVCAIAFSFGGAWCMARDEHIRITVLSDCFARFWRLTVESLGLVLGLVYLAGLSWGLWLQAEEAIWRFQGTEWRPELTPGPPHLPLPAVIKVAMLAACVLFACTIAARLVRLVATRKG